MTWVRTRQQRIFRSDMLKGFTCRAVPMDLSKVPPRTSLGGPASKSIEIFGLFEAAPVGSCEEILLATGYKSFAHAEEAIERFLHALENHEDNALIHEIPSL